MFVSVQKKKRKQPDKNGAPLRVEGIFFPKEGYYSYTGSDECFKRDNLDVYQFRLNHSYRVDGKVKKHQWNICSLSYYDIATLKTDEDDFLRNCIHDVASKANIKAATLWRIFYNKFQPLESKIVTEFEASEEYQTNKRNQELIRAFEKQKGAFDSVYGIGSYKYCYDFYGTLQNADYLEQLEREAAQKREQQRKSYEHAYKEQTNSERAYKEQTNSERGYTALHAATYNESERAMLKEIYRMASKKFHPDAPGGNEEKMKFLTHLKEQWGL